MAGPPRLRNKMQSGRPRPKTIHVDRSDTTDGTLTPSRGKKGSITNLASEFIINYFYNTHYNLYFLTLEITLCFFFL